MEARIGANAVIAVLHQGKDTTTRKTIPPTKENNNCPGRFASSVGVEGIEGDFENLKENMELYHIEKKINKNSY